MQSEKALEVEEKMTDFEETYQRNVDTVYRICFLHMRNRQETEDCVQEIFLKFYEKPKKFDSIKHEKAWFIVVAKNHCRDILKSSWRTKRVDFDQIEEPMGWDRMEFESVFEELVNLPEKYRTALYLYYYEGYSVREIAEMFSTKESTIQTRLANGRKKLKFELTKMEGYYG